MSPLPSSSSSSEQRKGAIRIVMCCFINRNYMEEAKVAIESLRKVGKFEGRISVITDFPEFCVEDVDVHVVPPVERVELAAGYRLKMLDMLEWTPDDIFLYLDTDILCVQNMQRFIHHALTIDDKLHVYGYNDIGLTQDTHPYPEYYAGSLTTDPRICNQPAWCSGILLFHPSDHILEAFRHTHASFTEFVSRTKEPIKSWEQRFLCRTFCDNECYAITLNPFVSEESYKMPDHRKHTKPPGIHATFHHFNGYRSNRRANMMNERMNHLLRTRH